jgi:glycosyltransferase involved in cell wall biosynthesis
MRIIFLNRYFHPDHSATSQMLSDLAFALAEAGAESGAEAGVHSGVAVSVVTSRQLYEDAARRLPARETIAGVSVHRVPTARFGRGNLAGRALDYASFYASAAWRLWRLVRAGDVVVTKTDPPMLSALTVPIARLKRARAINWLQDIFPEVAERLGMLGKEGRRGTPGRAAFALLRRLRDRSLKAADANVVLGARMAGHLAALGVARERIVTIPNWADGRTIAPIAPAANTLRRQWALGGLNDRFVVGYSGNLGRAHDIDTILDAIALIDGKQAAHGATTGPRVTWLLIGGGNGLETLRRRVAAPGGTMGSGAVQFEPYQPRERLAESLSAADVHLVSLRPELEGLIVPSKLYGIAAAGRPAIFIGDPDGEVARVIARAGCGLTIRQGDGAGLAKAILHLATAPALCAEMGTAARHLFEAEYDKPIAVARWQSLLARVGVQAQAEVRPGEPAEPLASRNAR